MVAEKPNGFEFEGFGVPESNFFKMPRVWTDITAGINNLAEIKVVEYILKHTWGYQEYGIKKRITTDEFIAGRKARDGSRLDKGTGLSAPSVRSGLKKAVQHGLIEEEIDDRDKARIKKYYSLRMQTGEQPLPESGSKHFSSDGKSFTPGRKKVSSQRKESCHRTEKESLDINKQKEAEENSSRESDDESEVVVVALAAKGIQREIAEQLAASHTPDYIREKIAYLESRLETDPQAIESPAGWLISAINKDFQPPKTSDHSATSHPEFALIADSANQKLEDNQARHYQYSQWVQVLKLDYATSDDLVSIWLRVADGAQSRESNSLQVRSRWAFANSALLDIQDSQALIAVADQDSVRYLERKQVLICKLLSQAGRQVGGIKFLLFEDQQSNAESDSS